MSCYETQNNWSIHELLNRNLSKVVAITVGKVVNHPEVGAGDDFDKLAKLPAQILASGIIAIIKDSIPSQNFHVIWKVTMKDAKPSKIIEMAERLGLKT